ncbi:SulP family inorganic anion transporter [Methyloversatilis universalis]|uniref:SulP family inorganic anion transporter n=1 Tax=Methyloversatilis universalis TaxID=378211 RepID=UPI0006858F65|nr:SulP family inorganic anion transporter [Methyloversatilis universalis]
MHKDDTPGTRAALIGDAWGGFSAMLVALPAAIAFGVTVFAPFGGTLAAEGAIAGIFGAIFLGVLAPLFGGRSLGVSAPSAPAAAVLAAFAGELAHQGLADTVLLQLGLIVFLAGVLQIVLGFAGVGRLIKFVPYPVVSGFLSAVGLILIGGQLPRLLGAPAGASLTDVVLHPLSWSGHSLLVGAVAAGVMVAVPKRRGAIPVAILALLAGILAYFTLSLFDPALRLLAGNRMLIGLLGGGDGDVADMLRRHAFLLHGFTLQQLLQVLAPALTLAALLSIDTLKTGLVVETMTAVRLDPDRELIGQGVGNLASALVGGLAGSATLGPSLVNISSGAISWRSSLLAGVFALLALFVLAPLIAWVPVAALAGILIVLGARMIDRRGLAFFFAPDTRLDFAVIVVVVLVALSTNLVAASAAGVGFSILLFIREQTRSSVVRSRIEGREIFSRRAGAPVPADAGDADEGEVVVFELQGSLFFGTASQLQSALEPEIGNRRFLILSMRRVQSLDVTATHVLEQIKDRLEQRDAYLVFCDIPKGLPSGLKMKRFLKETGVVRPSEKAVAFRQLDEALDWVEAQQMSGAASAQAAAALTLRDMPALAGCSPAALAALQAAVEPRAVKSGKRVFKSGADGEALFFVSRGLVRVSVPIQKKTQSYHLATCGPGELVGDMGFVEGGLYGMDALALTDVEVFALPRARFDALAAEHSELVVALLGQLTRSLAARLHTAVGEVQALRG